MVDIDLQKVRIETEWPVIARIEDDLYPYQGYDHIRQTARALAENEKGEFGFLHLLGEDYFGVRDHLETCGGGIEENEGIYEALAREINEEMGYRIRDLEMVGSILDAYNLIGRITLSHFAHVLLDTSEKTPLHRTEAEEILISEIVWLKPLDALERLKNQHSSDVDLIVQRRDAAALEFYLKQKQMI